jgi:uncharacterized protein YciI
LIEPHKEERAMNRDDGIEAAVESTAGAMAEAARLSSRMLKKRFFVMLRRCIDPARVPALLPAHLEWMIKAERRGLVFGSGPFVAPGELPGAGGGLTVLRASTREEAEAIAAADPFIAEGVFAYELKEWLLMEGSLSVTLSFSDQTYRID